MAILEGGNILFLNVSCGHLVNKKKNISTYGYAGKLLSVTEKTDEFEGQEMVKIKLKMYDEEKKENTEISFSLESWYSHGFFSRIMGADLSKTLVVGVSGSEQNEKVSFCWLKQGANTIKPQADFLKPEKKTIGKKTVTDWTEFLKLVAVLIPEINKKCEGNVPF